MFNLVVRDFEADPDRVTEILGIAPTRVSRKGDAGRSGRPRRFNDWSCGVEADIAGGAAHHTALNCILRQLHGREARFTDLREVIKPKTVTIYGALYKIVDEQCGVWLYPEQMRLLGACGVGWGLDVYIREPQE